MSARNPAMGLGVALAVAFGAWLRFHGLGDQVVQDDEWHAIHKLMASGYADIFRSFGLADHSIPLTLLYKAMAETIGLTEINIRIVQALAGIALIAFGAAIAWRRLRDPAIGLLFAWLLAGAPFLVLYSRIARPYAITTLLVVGLLAALWQWRETRGIRIAAVVCVLAALAAWLHPITAIFPAAGMAFILADDLRARKGVRGIVTLGALATGGMALLLAIPLMHDWQTLSAKAGGDHAGFYTVTRMVSLFAGGLPDAVTVPVALVAILGAARLVRTQRALGLYLLALAIVPVGVFMALGASWTQQGHTLARYVFPVQVIFLLWLSIGAMDIARRARLTSERAQLGAAAALAIAYVAINPAIRQVLTLGPWYNHAYHQFDYVDRHNAAALQYRGYDAPHFYKELGQRPAGSAPVIEAPFTYEAPANSLAFFRGFHGQPEKIGMLHDLCLDGPYYGEVPADPRFRFRNFVFLGDAASVRASGARYLLLHRDQLHGRPFAQADRCMAALTRLYGAPVDVDSRLAVFDLQRAPSARTLQ